jgi:hypothetical protein
MLAAGCDETFAEDLSLGLGNWLADTGRLYRLGDGVLGLADRKSKNILACLGVGLFVVLGFAALVRWYGPDRDASAGIWGIVLRLTVLTLGVFAVLSAMVHLAARLLGGTASGWRFFKVLPPLAAPFAFGCAPLLLAPLRAILVIWSLLGLWKLVHDLHELSRLRAGRAVAIPVALLLAIQAGLSVQ